MKWKKVFGGIKKNGLGGAVGKQLGQWSEAVVDQAEKIEAGVAKHGVEGVVLGQLDSWSSSEEQSGREAEERMIREREEGLRRKAEAEERIVREREELQKVLEISEQEEIRRKAEAQERELREREREQQQQKAAEKPLPKKVPFKEFMHKFLERDQDLDDEKAFAAMKMVGVVGVDDSILAGELVSLNHPMISQQVIRWFTTTDVIGDSDVFDI